FALGLVLNAIEAQPPLAWSTFRIPGVLRRIALVYVVTAWLTERTSHRTQAIVAAASLVAYWGLLMLVPVPGGERGVLTPDGNIVSFVDRALFGRHLANATWDPEGLLSTIPAVTTALIGVFAGDWLNRPGAGAHKSARLAAAGAGAAVVALAWDVVFPINKNLWTSSFALFSGGLAAILLGACHWVLDVKRWRGWETVFVAFGRNPLAAYFLSVAGDAVLARWMVSSDASLKDFVFARVFAPSFSSADAASLAYAAAYTASCS